jgi:hypothetical protein
MTYTEKEAKEKWCPYANVYVKYQNTGAAGNRGLNASPDVQGYVGDARCIASDCMAWRKVDQIGIGPNGEKRDRDMDGRTRWVDRGYCGAFGIPVGKTTQP